MSAHDDLMTALLVERFNGGGWKQPELTAHEVLGTMQRRALLDAAEAAEIAVVVELGVAG